MLVMRQAERHTSSGTLQGQCLSCAISLFPSLQVAFPSDMLMMRQAEAYEQQTGGACCYDDTRLAHAAVGLAHQLGPQDDRWRTSLPSNHLLSKVVPELIDSC